MKRPRVEVLPAPPDALEACRIAYLAGNLPAIATALIHCRKARQPLPDWLQLALLERLPQVRGWRAAQRKLEGMLLHLRRAEVLFSQHEFQGQSWLDGRERTAEELRGKFGDGDEDEINKSWQRALEISRDPVDRAFVGPYYSDLVLALLRHRPRRG